MNGQDETVGIRYQGRDLRPAFGRVAIDITYIMTHKKYGRTNEYTVVCEIGGIVEHAPCLNAHSATFVGDLEKDSNDETLTEAAAIELFEEQLS